MEIYLIRHTKTVVPDGICFGQTDVDVADSYSKEADAIKEKLGFDVDAVFASPLQRCTKLAEHLWPVTAITDIRLKELNFGSWEMVKWDDIPQDKLLEWTDNYVTMPPENGESFMQLLERVKEFFDEKIFTAGFNTVAIVTHAGVIRAMLSMALSISLQETFNYSVGHGCITKVIYTDGELKPAQIFS